MSIAQRLTKALQMLFLIGAIAFVQAFFFPTHAKDFTVRIDRTPLIVEIAQTPEDQRRGLQHRTQLPDDRGMLFVFLTPRPICMWMRDVPIDLDVGFFDEKMKLIQISHMKRQTDTRHCSKGAIAYALEVNRDWFDRHGLKVGARLHLD